MELITAGKTYVLGSSFIASLRVKRCANASGVLLISLALSISLSLFRSFCCCCCCSMLSSATNMMLYMILFETHYKTRFSLRVTQHTTTRRKEGRRRRRRRKSRIRRENLTKEHEPTTTLMMMMTTTMTLGKERSLSQRSSFDTSLQCPSDAKVHLNEANVCSVLCPSWTFRRRSHLESITTFCETPPSRQRVQVRLHGASTRMSVRRRHRRARKLEQRAAKRFQMVPLMTVNADITEYS